MPDPVDPMLAALDAAAEATDPPIYPAYLGKANSALIGGDVTSPFLMLVFSAEVAGHRVDIDTKILRAMYVSLRELLGDAITTVEEARAAVIADLEHRVEQSQADHEATKTALRDTEAQRDELQAQVLAK